MVLGWPTVLDRMLKASYTLNGELTQFQGHSGMEKMKNFQTVYECYIHGEICAHMDILYNQGRCTINKFSDNEYHFFFFFFIYIYIYLCVCENLSLF